MNTNGYLPEERAMFALRDLWRVGGYLPFNMSKFEEYDLYARNKDFLVSQGIITFTDKTGRLLALKPDVTLSIVKNFTYKEETTEKVYYHEHVYRPAGSEGEYKEILQSGLECIGDLDRTQNGEVVLLAAKSLRALGGEAVLQLSHLGILEALLARSGADETLKRKVIDCIGQKNAHDLEMICKEAGMAPDAILTLTKLISIHGPSKQALKELEGLSADSAYLASLKELCDLCDLLSEAGYDDMVRLDFSIVQDMRYYSGIVFRGYLLGIPDRVLSGGRYDRLVSQLGKKGGAIGFAVYLDLLERAGDTETVDADVLLLYDEKSTPSQVFAVASKLREDGERVMVQRMMPEKLRFARVVRLLEGGVLDEAND